MKIGSRMSTSLSSSTSIDLTGRSRFNQVVLQGVVLFNYFSPTREVSVLLGFDQDFNQGLTKVPS